MRRRFSWLGRALAAVFLFQAVAPGARADEIPSFLPNGDFSTVSGTPPWPTGWTNEAEGQVTREDDNGTPFLRLASLAPGQLVKVSAEAPLPPGAKGVAYDVRFRVTGLRMGTAFTHDAHTYFQFLDADGQPVKTGDGGAVFDSHAKEWTPLHRAFLVPDGAARLRIAFALNEPDAGTLDIAAPRLSLLPDAETQAMVQAPIVAARKEADDQAEVQRLLALPSKSVILKVAGNKIVAPDGTPVRLQGVNVESLEWSAKGENVLRSAKVAFVDWKANAIRLPVNDDFWFGRGRAPQTTSNDADAYRALVDDVVKLAAGQGGYVVLDLHKYHAPTDAHAAFWKDAAARYKDNPAVLFDLFNEPGGISWDQWKNGGDIADKPKNGMTPPVWRSPGMQALLDAARSTGAKNIVLAGGLGNSYDLSGIAQGFALEDKTGNGIVYAVHFYNWHKNWMKHFLFLADQYPLFVGECGADVKKMPFVPANQQEDPATWVPDALGMIQKYGLSWTAFSLHPKSTPVLISDWSYTPTPFWGVPVQEALGGKVFPSAALR